MLVQSGRRSAGHVSVFVTDIIIMGSGLNGDDYTSENLGIANSGDTVVTSSLVFQTLGSYKLGS